MAGAGSERPGGCKLIEHSSGRLPEQWAGWPELMWFRRGDRGRQRSPSRPLSQAGGSDAAVGYGSLRTLTGVSRVAARFPSGVCGESVVWLVQIG